jgi:hypothetical protein
VQLKQAACVSAAAVAAWLAAQEPAAVDFAREVLPILREHCFECHGARAHKAGLRLDLRATALAGAKYGKDPVIVPGDREASELWILVASEIEEERMPQADSDVAPLSQEQIGTLGRWIDEGAEWPDDGKSAAWPARHWSYLPPKRPPEPEVARVEWLRSPLDAFTLAKMEERGLEPNPQADPATLLRRASLDLTGLPPSHAELDTFLADSAPGAWQRALDRLLASPHYGEKLARTWLDLARYADSNGYEKDGDRAQWRWRDWVIEAFNADMPFDRFTIEQLAGDLLPGATAEQTLATGFHRNTMLNEEGGVDVEEFRIAAVHDRVATTGTVWLGATLGCAQCHDHKFDPISQEEYFRLFAIFNNTEDDGQRAAPVIESPTLAQRAERRRIEGEIAEARAALAEERADGAAARDAWTASVAREIMATPPTPSDHAWATDAPPPGARTEGDWSAVTPAGFAPRSGSTARLQQSAEIVQHFFEGCPDARLLAASDSLYAWVLLDPGNPPSTLMLKFHQAGEWEHRAYWGADTIPSGGVGTENAAHHHAGDLPAAGEWIRLAVPLAAVGLAPDVAVDGVACAQNGGRAWWDEIGTHTARSEAEMSLPAELIAALRAPPADADAQRRVSAHWRVTAAETAPLRERIADLEAALPAFPTAMVLRERAEPRSTRLLLKGSYLSPGEVVQPGVPAALNRDGRGVHDRREFAQWLVDGSNPLTARVFVNRAWEQIFGRGLVETVEDFGAQSPLPSHRELLDWLACEFVNSGWSVKELHRLILSSATYCQSADASADQLERDPHNEWLARAPRLRLPAEEVRDAALTASGLLVPAIGGPSVMPFQPAGVENAAYAGDRWRTAEGPDRWRRGLYTFWRRTSHYATFAAFDAPSREATCARRTRSNTPLQALALLNDPAFVEASAALGRRMRADGGAGDAACLSHGFRLCTARWPEPAELAVLRSLLEAERRASGEDRAWTLVANVMLNLDETVTRG